jgi:pyruvate/2-oxoacid:ferredoxin oxidoreductase alpha subunit
MAEARLATGNEAVAWAVARAGAEVVAAYPITPQTTIIEHIASLVAKGICKAEYVPVESEHSALAACIGAAHAGARAFTATSGQGLALMHELVHWAAGARLPIVLVDVNRAMAPPWSIWSDQNDSLSARDTGWIQLYCEHAQELFDAVVQAFALAPRVSIPVMVVADAFFLSHTAEPISVPDPAELEGFIPEWTAPWRIDPAAPKAVGGLAQPLEYERMRRQLDDDHRAALRELEAVAAEWRRRFNRGCGLLETYRCADADEIVLATGTVAGTARAAIDAVRARGRRAGLLKVRAFRPFPAAAIRDAVAKAKRVVVLDRNCSYGASGIFCQELRSTLHGMPGAPAVHGYVAGMGGRDITPARIEEALLRAERDPVTPESTWLTD